MSKEDTILEEDKTIKNGAEETVVSQSDKQPAPVADGKKRITVNKRRYPLCSHCQWADDARHGERDSSY